LWAAEFLVMNDHVPHDPNDSAEAVSVERIGVADVPRARAAFAMMDEVFEAESVALSDDYLVGLLSSETFWALVAFEGTDPVGCLTAHELPMTRHEQTELFVYDLAVRVDRQRRGIGRRLVDALVARAAAVGISVVFVPADEEDTHALSFYERVGGRPAKVTMFDLGAPR